MAENNNIINMRVASRRDLTSLVTEFVLQPVDGQPLVSFTAGSHITIKTPRGAMRRYSLVRLDEAANQYVIAVKKEPYSRGGSASMHEMALEDFVLETEPPENDFPLKQAPEYLLIAGGIGITPIYSMARELAAQSKKFNIIYCARASEDAAYLEELQAEFGGSITAHFDGGDMANAYDFWDHFAEMKNMHVYCCGPAPLMEEIKSISGHWMEGRVNFEDFHAVEAVREDDAAFDVHLSRSGKTVQVASDQTILEALRANGVEARSSCESGTCGSCKCGLLEGVADHRDMVLMEDEQSSKIMICVSRAKEGSLTLDI